MGLSSRRLASWSPGRPNRWRHLNLARWHCQHAFPEVHNRRPVRAHLPAGPNHGLGGRPDLSIIFYFNSKKSMPWGFCFRNSFAIRQVEQDGLRITPRARFKVDETLPIRSIELGTKNVVSAMLGVMFHWYRIPDRISMICMSMSILTVEHTLIHKLT